MGRIVEEKVGSLNGKYITSLKSDIFILSAQVMTNLLSGVQLRGFLT